LGAVKQCGASQWGEPQKSERILTSEVACMAACPLPARFRSSAWNTTIRS
jgi:hypothetical protein